MHKFIAKYPRAYEIFYEPDPFEVNLPKIKGPEFHEDISLDEILDSYTYMGLQASIFSDAVNEMNRMLYWRLSDEPLKPTDKIQDMDERRRKRCTIFLGQTSIVLTSGLRDIIRFLVQNKLVDAIVSTAGGIEEDLMKCRSSFYLGDFNMSGEKLRKSQLNRNGNIIVNGDAYVQAQELILPLLDTMLEEQKQGAHWSPSNFIERLALEVGDESSVCYWAAKNKIPVFCPAIIDGGIGEILYMHNVGNPGLSLDLVPDQDKMYELTINAEKSGALIVGGSLSKHLILNSQIPNGGLDYAVYINTAQEFDGSDGGARPDEAVSWGKITMNAKPVKLFAEASLVYPLLVYKTFLPYLKKIKSGEILI